MSESIVFVIRIWAGARFRAAVRRVDEEQTHLFETPAALTRFFVALSPSGERTDTNIPAPKTDDWRTR